MTFLNSKERVRFIKFATVGAIGSLVDIGVMNLMTQVFKMPLVLGGSISFVCAVANNFIGNRYWTYPDSRSKPMHHQLGTFFIISTIGISIRIPILKYIAPLLAGLFENITHLSNSLVNALANNVTLIFAIGVVMLWNFFVNRYWTYNDVD